MSTLIVIGNTNQYTFANAILAAREQSKKLFNEELDNIQVLHTPESFEKLLIQSNNNEQDNWIKYLEVHNIFQDKFIHRTIGINTESKNHFKELEKFIQNIEEIIDKNSNIIIDLSNGPTFQKNLLSVTSYILNIKHQYLIDIVKLFKLTNEKGFMKPELLIRAYVKAPESKTLDALAYLDLSEIKRYKDNISKLSSNLKQIVSDTADINFFHDNLEHSISLKLKGDKNNNNALYRIASASIASSAEELISLILIKQGKKPFPKDTLGIKLNNIYEIIKKSNIDIDIDFVKRLNEFILFLRNTTTHKDSQSHLSNLEKFKAELSVNTTLAFIEFYMDIVYPSLQENQQSIESIQSSIIYLDNPKINEIYLYGIDGDNTGAFLEDMLIKENTDILQKTSKNITDALNKIEKYIKEISKENKIIFKTGDDMLLKGSLNINNLLAIQKIYTETTNLTCSIGFGKNSKDAYIALKLAKAYPGKNTIKGIILT